MGDDWRVRIALDEDDPPELPESGEQALVAALRSRLSDQVAVTSNGSEIFVYVLAAGSADEAAQVARQVLARHDVGASVRTEFWSSLKEEWRNVTDEPSADPVAERRAAGRELSRKAGFPVWQVRVEVRSQRDVVALAWSGSSPVTAALMRRLPSGSGGSAIATCCLTPPAPCGARLLDLTWTGFPAGIIAE